MRIFVLLALVVGLAWGCDATRERDERTRRDEADERPIEPGVESSSPVESRVESVVAPEVRLAVQGRVVSLTGEAVGDLPLRLTPSDSGSQPIAASTDASGMLVASVELGASYRLDCVSNVWELETASDVDLKLLRAGQDVTLLAFPLFEVEVDVVLPDGTEPESALVGISDPYARDRFVPWNPKDRSVSLRRGLYTLHARADGVRQSDRARVIVDGSDTGRVVLALQSGTDKRRVAGRLLAGPGEQWNDVKIELTGPSRRNREREVVELSAGEPRFEFWCHRPGRYNLWVLRGSTQALNHGFDVDDSDLEIDLKLPPLVPENTATLTVLDPWGQPYRDLLIRQDSPSSNYPPRSIDAQGRWTIYYGDPELRRFEKGESVTWRIQGTSYGGGLYGLDPGIEVEAPPPGGHRTVQLELPAFAHLDCGPLPDELQGIGREVHHLASNGVGVMRVPADGKVLLPPWQPGPRKFELELILDPGDGGERVRYPLAQHTVSLVAGEQTVPLPFPELHSLKVGGNAVVPNREMVIRSDFSRPTVRRVIETQSEEEEAVFKYLPPGRYTVLILSDPVIERSVAIPDESEIVIDG